MHRVPNRSPVLSKRLKVAQELKVEFKDIWPEGPQKEQKVNAAAEEYRPCD